MTRDFPTEPRESGNAGSSTNPSSTNAEVQEDKKPSKSGTPVPARTLPCLVYSDNSNTNTHTNRSKDSKREFELKENIEHFITVHGLTNVVVITLTFPDDPSTETERIRWNSLATGVIRRRYRQALVVRERHDDGRRHYHIFVTLKTDVRTGCDFRAIKKRKYRTAPAALRLEWKYWRKTAPKYGFKRAHVMPVESDVRTVAHYFSKCFRLPRDERDRGARLVSYLGWSKVASSRLSWAKGGGLVYRDKCRAYANMLFEGGAIDTPTEEATKNLMRKTFGPAWARELRDAIARFGISEGEHPAFLTPMTHEKIKALMAEKRESWMSTLTRQCIL